MFEKTTAPDVIFNFTSEEKTPLGHTFRYVVALVDVASRRRVRYIFNIWQYIRKDTQRRPMGKAGIHLNTSCTIASM